MRMRAFLYNNCGEILTEAYFHRLDLNMLVYCRSCFFDSASLYSIDIQGNDGTNVYQMRRLNNNHVIVNVHLLTKNLNIISGNIVSDTNRTSIRMEYIKNGEIFQHEFIPLMFSHDFNKIKEIQEKLINVRKYVEKQHENLDNAYNKLVEELKQNV